MGIVLLEYHARVRAADGRLYLARAYADEARDGTTRWCGWIQFLPVDGRPPIRTGRETTQPNRICAQYWSEGLSPLYLEGALSRAVGAGVFQ
jgi:hypothetical protein